MSRYSGRYYRGASRDVRVQKRAEAEAREAARFDAGGWIRPGLVKVSNTTDQPEPLTGINGYPLRDD